MAYSDSTITISSIHDGGVTVLAVGGVIDLITGPTMQKAIDGLVDAGASALVIDLTEVTFMASIGLTILASTNERLGGVQFAVVADGPATSRPIQLTKLDGVFPLCSTLSDAMKAVRHGLSIVKPPHGG